MLHKLLTSLPPPSLQRFVRALPALGPRAGNVPGARRRSSHLLERDHGAPAVADLGLETRRRRGRDVLVRQGDEIRDAQSLRHGGTDL